MNSYDHFRYEFIYELMSPHQWIHLSFHIWIHIVHEFINEFGGNNLLPRFAAVEKAMCGLKNDGPRRAYILSSSSWQSVAALPSLRWWCQIRLDRLRLWLGKASIMMQGRELDGQATLFATVIILVEMLGQPLFAYVCCFLVSRQAASSERVTVQVRSSLSDLRQSREG